MDCMNTGCAVMAICHPSQNGLQYLRKEDAAITADDPRALVPIVSALCEDPDSVRTYAEKAIDCGRRNHQKSVVQKMLLDDMKTLTKK